MSHGWLKSQLDLVWVLLVMSRKVIFPVTDIPIIRYIKDNTRFVDLTWRNLKKKRGKLYVGKVLSSTLRWMLWLEQQSTYWGAPRTPQAL